MIVGLNLLYLLPGVVGGTETYAAGLLNGLAAAGGSDRFVVYLNMESAAWPLPDDDRFRRVVCPVRATSRLARYRYEQLRLPGRVRLDGADLLHSLGYVAPLHLPCPSVVTVHDVHHLAHGRRREWPRRLVLAVMVGRSVRRAAAVIAVSRYARGEIARAYRVPVDSIDVVPEAPNPRLADEAEGSATTRPGAPYLLVFGGLTPNKNLDRAVQAFAAARERHALSHRLVIVGHVPPGIDVSERAAVECTGYLPESRLAGMLAGAEALIFPSLYEGFGLPVLEAMAAGVPVVCSNAAAIPEVAGDAAIYFDPLDIGDMAAQIGLVATDASLRRDLAARGRAQAARYSWDRAGGETLAIYRRVLGEPDGSPAAHQPAMDWERSRGQIQPL